MQFFMLRNIIANQKKKYLQIREHNVEITESQGDVTP